MRTKEQIENQILEYLKEHEIATLKEMGIELRISPRFMNKIVEDMEKSGKIQEYVNE